MTAAAVAAGVVMLGAVPRLLLAAGVLPDALRPFVWSDVMHTWERGLAGGLLPYWDTPFEYPPLVGYLSGLFSVAAPNAFTYVLLWAAAQALLAAAIAAVLVRAGAGTRVWSRWALAPQLLLLGSVNFDLLAILGSVLAIHWIRAGAAPQLPAAAIALGTAAKLFPAALIPPMAYRYRRPSVRGAAELFVLVLVLVALYAPAATARYPAHEGIGRYGVGVPANFDSVWGIAASVATGLGMPASPIVLALTLGGLVLTYVVVVLPSAARARDFAVPAALALLTLMLWSRLYSPQFSLWALPLFALLPVARRAFVLLAVADVGVFLTVYPLTLRQWPPDDQSRTLLIGIMAAAVVLRHAALLIAWMSVRRIGREATASGR